MQSSSAFLLLITTLSFSFASPLHAEQAAITAPADKNLERCVLPKTEQQAPMLRIGGKVAQQRLRHDLPLAEVQAIERENEHPNADQVLGFTSYEARNSFSFTVHFTEAKEDAKACVWIEDLTASFDVNLVDVFVPSEYKEDACEYRAVRRHEEEHVEILRRTHTEFLELLQYMLKAESALPDFRSPVIAVSAQEAKVQIESQLKAMLDDFTKDFIQTLSKHQQAIDTDENYKAVLAQCNGWWKVEPESVGRESVSSS